MFDRLSCVGVIVWKNQVLLHSNVLIIVVIFSSGNTKVEYLMGTVAELAAILHGTSV